MERARTLLGANSRKAFDCCTLISGAEGMATGPGSDRALAALLKALGASEKRLKQPGPAPTVVRADLDPSPRQQRQVKELQDFTQEIFRQSKRARADSFWNRIKAASPQDWESAVIPFRKDFWEEHLGRLPSPVLPANPRTRKLFDRPTWTGYEAVLDVYPEVFAWGYLLVPKDLKPGERRPVVVCQHGLEGLPASCLNEDPNSEDFKYYKGFAAQLAAEGFVVFAPHAPYRGHDRFRQLQRKANPLKASLFSVIVAQHSRLLDWLGELPFVDAKRIGFYGLSYGGAAAMRVPAVLDRYALSICSGNFNDWIRKNVSLDSSTTYLIRGEYEMVEFDLGDTFNHAEMAALIAPRPFMVERGRHDSVGVDEWVAGEYAKVRRFYDQLGIPDRTAIEFFDGGHAINGVGTFDFLRRHLDWPKPKQ